MEQYHQQTSRRSFNCIVADDSLLARKTIQKIIERSGGRVVAEAANGKEAVDLYFVLKPDLVLLDISMPELDGIEALKKIISTDSNAKVIMVSSVGDKEMVFKAISLGASHFILKPYNSAYASMIINSVLQP